MNGSFFATGTALDNTSVRSASAVATLRPTSTLNSYALTLQNTALAGGSNQLPNQVEVPPYFKSTYAVMYLKGSYSTQGQHVQMSSEVNCYGVGDCLAGGQFVTSEGGLRDSGDEGTHPFDLSVQEDASVFTGVCSSGCSTGSTLVTTTATTGPGTEGEGRYLIDTNPAKVITSGTLVGSGSDVFAVATFAGTSFPASVFLSTTQAATSQATNMAPGTVTLGIATSALRRSIRPTRRRCRRVPALPAWPTRGPSCRTTRRLRIRWSMERICSWC